MRSVFRSLSARPVAWGRIIRQLPGVTLLSGCAALGAIVPTAKAQQPQPVPRSLSGEVAFLWSLGATAVPVVTGALLISNGDDPGDAIGGVAVALGILAGPGAGHLYAHNGGAFGRGVLIRGLAGGLFVLGVAAAWSEWESTGEEGAGQALLVVGAGAVVAGAIYDFATVGKSVRKYNARHIQPSLSIRPAVIKGHPGAVAALSLNL